MMNSKKAAMEMSIGTIVTIVLSVTMLILGVVLIKNIFSSATNAVSVSNEKMMSEMNSLFTKEGTALAFSPSDRKVRIKQGAAGEGFAFLIKNENHEDTTFEYALSVSTGYELQAKCGIATAAEVEAWITQKTGTIDVPADSVMEEAKIILFDIPKNAPKCTIPYTLKITNKATGKLYVAGTEVFIIIV